MNRTVVVSGGGTGIGRAVAHGFARAGDHVVIVGRREDVLRSTAETISADGVPGTVEVAVADLADPDQVQALVDARFAEGSGVDVLVAAAGGLARRSGGTLHDVAAELEESVRTNVLTAVLLTAALRPKLRRPGGRVIALSSIAALRGGGSYGAAKAALHAWAFTLAAELGPEGITVNVVAPGFVEDTEFFGGAMTPERRQRLVDATLVGRAAHPDDVAGAVEYLASDQASYVTGQILQVNGGALLGR
jgi:3-oxoacyl-[acyl-carrier protein] reductase